MKHKQVIKSSESQIESYTQKALLFKHFRQFTFCSSGHGLEFSLNVCYLPFVAVILIYAMDKDASHYEMFFCK